MPLRGSSRGSERGAAAGPLVIAVAAGMIGGATVGFAMQDGGSIDLVAEPAPLELRADRVDVLDCPAGSTVSQLARGDQVLATGRTDDGRWLEIRSPLDLGSTAWIAADLVDGVAGATATGDLPVHRCGPGETTTTATLPETTTSSSSSTTSSTSSTTSTTATTLPLATTTTLPPTTTTAPNVGPQILGFTVTAAVPEGTEPQRYVHEDGADDCFADAVLSVQITDPDGVGSVSVQWATGPGGATALVPITPTGDGATWTANFRFTADAVPDTELFRLPTFTVSAADGRGAVQVLVVSPAEPPVENFAVFDSEADCVQQQ